MSAPSAKARSKSAQVCIIRLRTMMFRSVTTAIGRSGRQRVMPSTTRSSDGDANASLTTIFW